MTTIVPAEVGLKRVQAVFLKAHLLLMSAGMKHSQISGKTYKRGQYGVARKDLID